MNRLYRLRFVGLALLGVGLAVAAFFTLRASDTGNSDGNGGRQRVVGRLGPTPGPDSVGHIKAKRAYLAKVARDEPGRKAAGLVSLDRFMPLGELANLVKGMDAAVVFLRFPSSDQPESIEVRGGLVSAVTARAEELQGELEAEFQALEKEMQAAQGKRKDELTKLIAERKKAAAQVRANCVCVFAVAVEKVSLERLATLSENDGVRFIDVPDPLVDDLSGWGLTPLLPAVTPAPKV